MAAMDRESQGGSRWKKRSQTREIVGKVVKEVVELNGMHRDEVRA
jgi:hypothetical protein